MNAQKKTVVKWADEAMFKAEPIAAEEGPRVYLLWMTPDPLAAIAAPSKMYKGQVVRSFSDVTNAERHEFIKEILNTKLQMPFEAVKFHFVIEGVTRAFTHQMVRQRTAAYAQQSDRFAVQEDGIPVGLPPSLHGTESSTDPHFQEDDEWNRRSDADKQRAYWDAAIRDIQRGYSQLIQLGMPQEDARGLLPTNLLTRLHYITDLRSLLDHGGNRLCTQAQFEWRLVFTRIVEAIRKYNPYAQLRHWAAQDRTDQGLLLADWLDHHTESDRWQYETIANIFRPVCYLTGKCEFKADFDRKCSIRDRVDAYAAAGTPSEHWHKGVNPPWGEGIKPIFPAEWLLNPGAAR